MAVMQTREKGLELGQSSIAAKKEERKEEE